MNITIINQFYPPDLSPTGKLAASLAIHRAVQGDQVTVIAGRGYADTTKKSNCPHHSAVELDTSPPSQSLHVRRIWTPQLGKKSLWRRVTDYAIFFVLTIWTAISLPRQDILICLTTPPFIAIAGVLHKLFHRGARMIVWNMDCYPEVMERAGIIKANGLMSRVMQLLNRWLESSVDHIICLDSAMRDLVGSRGRIAPPNTLPDEHTVGRPVQGSSLTCPVSVLTNWEPLRRFRHDSDRSRDEDVRVPREFIVLYSGNMGHGHCFETMHAAANQLHDQDSPVRFVLTGGGVQLRTVQQEVNRRQLSNIDFLEYIPDSQLRALQKSAGCSLITLKDNMLGVMSPSKLHSSLAMGLPILYVGPGGSNVYDAIHQFRCGVHLHHGDVDGFVKFVEMLRTNSIARASYRARARQAFDNAYCDEHCLPMFDQIIDSVAGLDVDDDLRRAA